MLDISPYLEQAIISQAQQQGVSVNELLAGFINEPINYAVLDSYGLYSEFHDLTIDQQTSNFLNDLLEQTPIQTPALKELLVLGEKLV